MFQLRLRQRCGLLIGWYPQHRRQGSAGSLMRKRGYISHDTELAAALLMYRDEDGRPWIPHEHAKKMSAEQVISLFERQHVVLHSHDGPDTHWNIVWLPFL